MLDLLIHFALATAKESSEVLRKRARLIRKSELCREKITQAMLAGDKKAEALATLNLGNIQYQLGNRADALSSYTIALSLATQVGNPAIEATALCNLGQMHVENLEYPQAYSCYFRAQALIQDGNNSVKNMVTEKIRMLDYIKKFDSLSKERETTKS